MDGLGVGLVREVSEGGGGKGARRDGERQREMGRGG